MSTFGVRLSKLRTEKKLTQAELANRLNIAKSTLAMYETDKREPSFETVQKIADFFDVKVDYLLGRTNDPSPISEKTEEDLDPVEKHLTTIMYHDLKQLRETAPEKLENAAAYIRFLVKEAAELNKNKKKNDT